MLLIPTGCSRVAKVHFALPDKKRETLYQETAARENCMCLLTQGAEL